MNGIRVDSSLPSPPSQQLQAAVLDAIARGELGVGDRLPSVRAVAEEALVNPNTVGKAWRALEMLGVVEGRNGSGVFVTPSGPERARALRGGATRDEFERAARAALAAGHPVAELQRFLERLRKERLEGSRR